VLVLVILGYLVPVLFGQMASFIYAPILSVKEWFLYSSDTLPSYFRDRNDLIGKIETLEKDLRVSRNLRQTVTRLQHENDELRKLLGNSTSTSIGAGIIGLPPSTPYDTLIIDKGSRQGITKSAPVFVSGDVVIGFVEAVYPFSSVVTLVSTPGYESTAYILGPNIYTTAEGMGGGVLRVHVPQGIEMQVGDVVVLPALDGGTFGTISYIESTPTQPEQFGYVTSETALHSLRTVRVGMAPLEPISYEEAKAVVDNLQKDLLVVSVPDGVLMDVTSTTSATSTSDQIEFSNEAENTNYDNE